MGYRFRLHVRIPIEVGRASALRAAGGKTRNGARGATRPTSECFHSNVFARRSLRP